MQKGNTAKAMLTDEAFRAWCQRNQIAPETETYIQRIRSSQPVRKVQSHASNVTSGGWRCPPGEATAQALGLSHRVRTSNEYHPFYIQNLMFLQDFWTHPLRLEAQAQAQVLEALRVYPGVSVAALLDAHPELAVDVIWAMLTSQHIFTDLAAASLMDWEQVFLYPSFEEVEAEKQVDKPVSCSTPLASPLIFDGRLW